jgi:hypothetical protein
MLQAATIEEGGGPYDNKRGLVFWNWPVQIRLRPR